jgi:hypothetical protein
MSIIVAELYRIADPTLAAGVISAFLTKPDKIEELYGAVNKQQRKIIQHQPNDVTLVHPEQMKRHRTLRNDITNQT